MSEDDAAGDTLAPEGTVTGEDGILLGAPPEALDDSLDVSIEPTSDPTTETPLPDEARPVGDFYRLSAGRDLDVRGDAPLALALPVPEGVDSSRLALGIRIPTDQAVPDQGLSSKTHVWSVMPAAFDPDDGMLVVRLRALSSDGHEIVLLEGDGYDSPSIDLVDVGEDTAATSSRLGPQRFLRINFRKPRENFIIKCVGFGSPPDPTVCGSSQKQAVRSYLDDVYSDFVSEFRKPDLARIDGEVNGQKGAYYLYKIRKDDTGVCGDVSGMYIAPTNLGITCHEGTGTPSETTTRMEFFHAIQYNYPSISWSKKRRDWIIEGTASFVENPSSDSSTAIRDGSRDLRDIDTALMDTSESDDPAYEVQDFWVYLINAHSSTPEDVLDPLFRRGATTGDVDDMLTSNGVFSSGSRQYDLEDAHWGWVRNQAFESTETTGNSALNGQCVFNPAALGGMVETLSYDAGSRTDTLSRSVGPIGDLKATVVKIELENGSSSAQLVDVAASGSLDARVKLYEDVSSPTSDCVNLRRARPNEHARAVSVAPGQTETLYALLSNSDRAGPVETFDLEVSLREAVGIEITEPAAGAAFPEGTLVGFEADVQLPQSYELNWSTDGEYAGAGSITGAGTSLLCPGDHTITAEATTQLGDETVTVSDEVDIEIENREPKISITKRPEGDTIAEGDSLTLRARAEDRVCTTGHTFNAADPSEIVWRINGVRAGSGTPFIHEVEAPAGSELRFRAEYTDEAGATARTETLTFDVTEPPEGPQPPNATIVHPPAGETLHRTSGDLRLEAEASDPDGGAIQSYTWVVTDRYGKSKTYHGNDIEIQLWTREEAIFSPGDFTIEVTVTDDEGQRTSTSIQVEVIPGL